MNLLLSTAYAPPVSWIKAFLQAQEVSMEQFEHFPKQTYRNRCCIAGPNGSQDLIIPLSGRKDKTLTKDIRIDYTQRWQNLHWRSLEAAYRRSPFFEFYEDDLHPLYEQQKWEYLMDFNEQILKFVLDSLKINKSVYKTEQYYKNPEQLVDYRNYFVPNKIIDAEIKYMQVFESRNGFIADRSILDLLFCEGPRGVDFLK